MQIGVGGFGDGGYPFCGREFSCSDPDSPCGDDFAGHTCLIEWGVIVTDLFRSINWGVDFSRLFRTIDLILDASEFVYYIVRGFIDEIGRAGG